MQGRVLRYFVFRVIIEFVAGRRFFGFFFKRDFQESFFLQSRRNFLIKYKASSGFGLEERGNVIGRKQATVFAPSSGS